VERLSPTDDAKSNVTSSQSPTASPDISTEASSLQPVQGSGPSAQGASSPTDDASSDVTLPKVPAASSNISTEASLRQPVQGSGPSAQGAPSQTDDASSDVIPPEVPAATSSNISTEAPSMEHVQDSAPSSQGPPQDRGNSRRFKSDWQKISTITSIALGIISIVFSLVAINQNQKNVRVLQEQLNVQQETFVRDLPIQFAVSYKLPPSKDVLKEFVAIENTGRIDIFDTVAELNFYFVYPDGTIHSIPEVEISIRNNPTLLSQIRGTNFLMNPQEIDYLLGGRRRFPVLHLAPGEMSITDINASLNLNALRLAKLLGAEVIARWRIEYKEGVSRKRNASYAFIWIHDLKPSQLKDREEFTREDLSSVIGGKQIITDLIKREETSKEVIFGIEPQNANPEPSRSSSTSEKRIALSPRPSGL
jgi:hypothetical protein